MKIKNLILHIPVLFLLLIFNESARSEENKPPDKHPIMRPESEAITRWMNNYWAAPKAKIDENINIWLYKQTATSVNLLNYLDYSPPQRSQGSCSNCWVWAGTGMMEIAHTIQNNIYDRLSIEFFDACINNEACAGGGNSDSDRFVTGYKAKGFAIPWSNKNAAYADGGGSVSISCNSIVSNPRYYINSIQMKTIPTYGVGQAKAILNIKNLLNQHKAIWYAFFLPNDTAWSEFYNFWNNETEDALWKPDNYCNQAYNGGGHVVMILGYNDDDSITSHRYWVALNSWGTTSGRPNGLYRIPQQIDYDCQYSNNGLLTHSFQTMDVSFTNGGHTPAADSGSDNNNGNGNGGGGKKCFIATAAYGTPFAREVQVLRNFRDAYLLTNDMGQGFVSFYYKYSPPIADFIRDNSFLRAVVRTILRPIVWLVQNLCPQCNPAPKNASAQQPQAEVHYLHPAWHDNSYSLETKIGPLPIHLIP